MLVWSVYILYSIVYTTTCHYLHKYVMRNWILHIHRLVHDFVHILDVALDTLAVHCVDFVHVVTT